jgi:DNA-binding NarL/FixJ family response regulator
VSEDGPVVAATPLRVLLVDDAEEVRFLVRRVLLRDQRFTVVAEATNGRLGVEEARLHQPDVLLLDLAMPVLDGLAALPLIREAAPDARVVILSGFAEGEMGRTALERGAIGYAQKGLPPDRLLARLAELLHLEPLP